MARPRPGVRIKSSTVNDISGVFGPLRTISANHWTDPVYIVSKIKDAQLELFSPAYTLVEIQKGFEHISKSRNANVSKQLSTFASKCHEYSLLPAFTKQFISHYETKRCKLADRRIVEHSKQLAHKGKTIGYEITDKAMDQIRSSTLSQLDVTESGSNWWHEAESIGDADFTIKRPSSLDHSPNKPKLTSYELRMLRSKCYFAMSSVPLSMIVPDLANELQQQKSHQFNMHTLKQCTKLFNALGKILDNDYEHFVLAIWNTYNESIGWEARERDLLKVISLTLTDYWGFANQAATNLSSERSPWVERVVPLFKYFGATTNLIVFYWCEDFVDAIGNVIPGVWKNDGRRRFADGVGRMNSSEKVVLESSSSFDEENMKHTLEDTGKLAAMTTDLLRTELLHNKDASYETGKKLAVYGIQCIKTRLTLTKTSIYDENHWQILELRSADIPITWNDRFKWIKVFELLVTLYDEIAFQEKVLSTTVKELNQVITVKSEDTIGFKLSSSQLL